MISLSDAAQAALEALQTYGSHAPNCDHLVLLTSLPPQRKPCSCGLGANISALRAALADSDKLSPGEPVAWIQPDHLQKARQAPFLSRVEPTQRFPDFVPLYLHPAPAVPEVKAHQIRELVNQLRDIAIKYHDHQSLRDRLAGPVHDLWLLSIKREQKE